VRHERDPLILNLLSAAHSLTVPAATQQKPFSRIISSHHSSSRGWRTYQTIDGAMTTTMRIACAEPTHENLKVILGLIEEARGWLEWKDTDQWQKPWPDTRARDARVLRGLEGGKTWIVWDGDIPAATVTITPRKNAAVWSAPACTCNLAERAVFVHRLITARKYGGLALGEELIDWAGLRGQRLYGAKWIRIDVWSTNKGLHDYYVKRGFEPCGFCADSSYPSGALFQKPVSAIIKPSVPLFVEPMSDRQGPIARSSLPVRLTRR
jgi:hypothetical protein